MNFDVLRTLRFLFWGRGSACTPLPSPPLREHAATHSRPRARPAMRPMPAHDGAAGLGRGALASPRSLSIAARTFSQPLLALARQHEPHPHPAPHHPHPSARCSLALCPSHVFTGTVEVESGKLETGRFLKTTSTSSWRGSRRRFVDENANETGVDQLRAAVVLPTVAMRGGSGRGDAPA